MVKFETAVYEKAGDNITGVKVVVLGETGEVLDTVQIHNKTEFDALVTELNGKLDVIDEMYIQVGDSSLAGLSIEEILENSNGDVDINATTLDGQSSSSFSQTDHTHRKSAIVDLYNFQLTCDSRNITLGDTVNLSVQVNDQRGVGVSSAGVYIYIDNVLSITGATNNQGAFTSTYTPNTVGLHCIAIGNQKEFINVKKSVGSSEVITGKATVYYDRNIGLCQVIVNGTFSISSSGSLGTNVLANFRPKSTIPMAVFTTGLNISIHENNGNIYYVNNSGSNGSKTVVASATYFYK